MWMWTSGNRGAMYYLNVIDMDKNENDGEEH